MRCISPPARAAAPLLLALAGSLALACGQEEAKAPPAPAPAAAAAETPEPAADARAGDSAATPAEPQGTVRATTHLPDGRVFEAEYGKEGQLPSAFPDDVPLYADARPMASVATANNGTIVNLRTHDAPERVLDWYRDHFAKEGWEVEHEQEARGHSILAVRKGNRVASVVITGVPQFTQVMLTVAEDR